MGIGSVQKSVRRHLGPRTADWFIGGVTEERPLRIWIDDHNPIFRLGLGACLEPPFLLAGESARFSPLPDLTRTDILVFELEQAGLPNALRLARDTDLLLVTIAADI